VQHPELVYAPDLENLQAPTPGQQAMVPVDPDRVFSRFCRAVEDEVDYFAGHSAQAKLKAIKSAMARAAVIRFDKSDYDAALAAVKSAEKIDLYLPPMMPFDEVVLYDQHGAVFFLESVDHEEGVKKAYVDTVDLAAGGTHRVTESVLREATVVAFGCDGATDTAPGSWWLAIGRIGITAPWAGGKGRGMSWSDVAIATAFTFDGKPEIRSTLSMTDQQAAPLAKALRADFYHSVVTALDEMYYIDLPRHHLVVETPRSYRQEAKERPKIPRIVDRPRVRIINPEHVANIRPATASDGTVTKHAKSPHPRRGYTKYLTSDKWVAKRWQRIRIRPTWVGPGEWDLGKFQYRVVVRKNDERSSAGGAPVAGL
jgi:hypothetical protein